MARKELPRALTLERFAAGKDGRANAFKKKKQANKRKLFEKAQLKRQYAKLLKKEAATAGGAEVHANIKFGKAAQSNAVADVGDKERAGSLTLSPKRKRKERAEDGETNPGCDDRDGHEKGQREQHAKKGGQQQRGKWRRPEHRPDPFKAAKATADQRRQETEEKQHERDMQEAEKNGRAKKRRKQHALLSKRTRGGQPVMKHTMQYLLEKIQSQR